MRYNDPSGHAATSAYRAQTPYNIAPYAGTFDTGNNLADMALGIGGGLWNLGASLLNSVASMALGTAESGYNVVETNYNDLTSHYLGDEGFTGNGFAEDMNAAVFATTSMPIEVAYFKQSLSFLKIYSAGMVINAGGKVKATLASERGSLFLGENKNLVYRVIRPDENPTVGIVAKNPTASYKVEGHILHGSRPDFRSQYISTTRDLETAQKWAEKSGNRIIQINLNNVNGTVIDLSTEIGRNTYLNGVTAKNWARASSEVLIEGEIPASAIKLLQ